MSVSRAGACLLAVVMLIATACGNDDDLAAPVEELSAASLPQLVLPPGELGGLGDDFEVDHLSGELPGTEPVGSIIIPGRTTGNLDLSARDGAYELIYYSPGASGDGDVIDVGSHAELWQDADAASASMEEALEDFEAQEGDDLDGWRLESVSTVDAGDIASEDSGIHLEFVVPGAGPVHVIMLSARLDRLVLSTTVIAFDEPRDDEARDIAARHVEWAEAVITGKTDPPTVEIPAEPTPIPEPTPEPEPTPAENGDDLLGQVALQLDDLPGGFMLVDEYLDPAGAGLADFTREFEAENMTVAVGDSRIISIENNVMVFASSSEAGLFASAVASVLDGEEGEEFLRQALEDEGLEPRDLSSRRVELDLGDETVVILVEAETGFGDFVLTYTITRHGDVISALITTAMADGFNMDDIEAIATIVLDRIAGAGLPE